MAEQKQLLRHATGVLALSTWFTGLLQARAANRSSRSESQFRTAHVGGTLHAVFLYAMAGVISKFCLTEGERKSLTYNSILMGWTNTLGYTVGAMLGKRGLKFTGLDGNLPPLVLFCTAMYALAKVLYLSWKGSRPLSFTDEKRGSRID